MAKPSSVAFVFAEGVKAVLVEMSSFVKPEAGTLMDGNVFAELSSKNVQESSQAASPLTIEYELEDVNVPS